MKLRAQTYRQAIGSTVAQQTIVLLLAGMILDGEVILEMCGFAAVAFWIGVGLIWFRRRSKPTQIDILVIEAGYIVLCVISFFLSFRIWTMRGVL